MRQLQIPYTRPEGGHAGPAGGPLRRSGQTRLLRRAGHEKGSELLRRGSRGPEG